MQHGPVLGCKVAGSIEKRAECRNTGVRTRFSTLSPFLGEAAVPQPVSRRSSLPL